MDGLPIAFLVSLLLGMRHATDPDHIVAITTIVQGERQMLRSTSIGIMWGLGHSLMIVFVGTAIILFKLALTPRLGLSLEFCVALMLITLGALNVSKRTTHSRRIPKLRPFAIGVVHGMAGTAATTLLILPFISDTRLAVLYLTVFGAGTIVGMALVTTALAAPAAYAGARLSGIERHIRIASGAISLAFGAYLSYKIGFVDGLFRGAAYWNDAGLVR